LPVVGGRLLRDAPASPRGRIDVEVLDAVRAEHDEPEQPLVLDRHGGRAGGDEPAEEGAILGVRVQDRQVGERGRARGPEDGDDRVAVALTCGAQLDHGPVIAQLRARSRGRR
jgi:hypothetical protein